MKFDLFKDPLKKEVGLLVVLTEEELARAFDAMHPVHRKLLNNYFNKESTPSDLVFGISEVMKALEDVSDDS